MTKTSSYLRGIVDRKRGVSIDMYPTGLRVKREEWEEGWMAEDEEIKARNTRN